MQGLLSRTRLETVAGHGNDRGPGPAEYLVEDSVDAAHCQSATSCEQRPNTTTWRDDVAWVHWAPPCGTFSRAREIPRPDAPQPLAQCAPPGRPQRLKAAQMRYAFAVRTAYLPLWPLVARVSHSATCAGVSRTLLAACCGSRRS